jgi:uncharacterized DUF497 family protein
MYNGMRFEWDADKERANRKKHGGLDFELAARAFSDPNVVFLKDRVVDGEQRCTLSASRPCSFWLWCRSNREENENGEENILIISAREADQCERRIYIQQAPD